jgi:hypothetical protein
MSLELPFDASLAPTHTLVIIEGVSGFKNPYIT